jgi:2-aminoadipate transaminase
MEHLLPRRAREATSSAIRDLLRVAARPDLLSLAGGLPAAELFPVDELRAVALELLSAAPGARAVLQYGPTEGSDDLRAQLGATYDVPDSQVLVTTGSQQALDLLARTLVDPGDVVVVESPAYLGALQAWRGAGAQLVAIRGDAHGMDVDELAARLARGLRPKLCSVVPNFSNPSGATLAPERRRALARLADRYGFVVVEDDPYRELRFHGEPLPPVRSFGARVVTLGSASKTLAPGLRVGWAVLPPALVGPFVKQKQAADLHTSTLAQAIVASALRAPWYAGQLARLRDEYGRRARALGDALVARPGTFVPPDRPAGGMFVWVALRDRGADTSGLLAQSIAHGVAYVPGAAFDPAGAPSHRMRLSFATLPPAELEAAVARLEHAVTLSPGAPAGA